MQSGHSAEQVSLKVVPSQGSVCMYPEGHGAHALQAKESFQMPLPVQRLTSAAYCPLGQVSHRRQWLLSIGGASTPLPVQICCSTTFPDEYAPWKKPYGHGEQSAQRCVSAVVSPVHTSATYWPTEQLVA
jgi:hypothetical protein